MKLITKEKRLELLTQSIINKTNKESNPHEEINASIKKEIIALVNEWGVVSKPENCISKETKDLLEKLQDAIYLTFKNHENDPDNGDSQESST